MRRFSSARRGPLVRMTVLAVGLGLSVAGCSGAGSGPGTAPTSGHVGTPDASTTATPTSNPTDVAAAAAIAAVKRLYAELNNSLVTGRTTEYRRSFTSECKLCLGNAETIDKIHEKRQHIVGGTFFVSRLVVVWNQPNRIIVQGVLRSNPLTVRMGSRVIQRDPGSAVTAFTWDAKPSQGQWMITRVQVLK